MFFPRSEETIEGSLLQIAPDAPCVMVAYGVNTTEKEDAQTEELSCYSLEVAISEYPDIELNYKGLSALSTYEDWVAVMGEPIDNEARKSGTYSWKIGEVNGGDITVNARDYTRFQEKIVEIVFFAPIQAERVE